MRYLVAVVLCLMMGVGFGQDEDILGCTISVACNYNPEATVNDGSCDFFSCLVYGCNDIDACNYDPDAYISDGSCAFPGCMDLNACNYDVNAGCDNGNDDIELCEYITEGYCDCEGSQLDAIGVCGGDCTDDDNGNGVCDELEVYGCTYPDALNFNEEATADDGSCIYEEIDLDAVYDSGYTDGFEDGENSVICPETSSCPSDLNGDGSVGMSDLLIFLSSFGDVCEIIDNPWMCGDLIEHEGYDYSTVQIGEQCWFAENCRYLPEVSPSSEGSEGSETDPYYYVYGYEGTDVTAAQATTNYATYGVLYNWPAVMTEGICPSGWHIPSDEEFTELTDFLGGTDVAGGKMKEAGYEHWLSPNTGATNSSGWTGLPGGFRFSGGFDVNGDLGGWWSASESGSYSWGRVLSYYYDSVDRYLYYRYNGFSARCVRD